MTRRLVLATVCGLVIGSGMTFAQTPTPAQPGGPRPLPNATTPAPPPPPPTQPATQRANVRVDFTITDQRGTDPPVKRVVTVITADGNLGRVRSVATAIIAGQLVEVPLNVDVTPTLTSDTKLRLQLALSYDLPVPADPPSSNPFRVTKTAIQDSVTLMLENGKSMIAAQSADPIGDRTVTVEVKATILR